ncbi:MarR family winged helix-turn-helix transcriptional regulator [Umezawaea endophytica]|uniref:MarR family transcriptional regulator n=1 Tax=Umezawaea endophytica TaxID=1654476 RepID=A0A9X3AKF0_9PSEU|nr:MarR family transcriptional regulator [Umezawaea endophytica]MCS7482775.1 MarR family transcriptional regulator [Umezawaea endophytica]
MSVRPPSLLALPSYVGDQVAKYGRRHLKEVLAADDLLLPQYGMLVALADFGPISQQRLAESLDMDKSHLVGKIDKLADRGLLAREPDPVDRRRHRIVLTPKGEALVDRVRPIAEESQRQALAVLSEEERAVLESLLLRVLEAHDGERVGE